MGANALKPGSILKWDINFIRKHIFEGNAKFPLIDERLKII